MSGMQSMAILAVPAFSLLREEMSRSGGDLPTLAR